MKKVLFSLAAALTCAFAATSASASGDEYYERGEGYEHGGRYGYGSGAYEGKFYGPVESMPQGGIFGMWRVGGREVLVTERTFIKEEYGRIGLGAQVEVKGGGNPFVAYEVEVKSSGRAMMGPPPGNFPPPVPPPAMGPPSGNFPPASPPPPAMVGTQFDGAVEAMPQGSMFGMWKIGGKEVVVTDSTLIKQQNGPLAPGAQVNVKGGGIPFIAHELEVKVKSGNR